MSLPAFETYNSAYQTLTQSMGHGPLVAVLLALTILPAAKLKEKQPVLCILQALTLSVGVGALLFGCYYLLSLIHI